jgi:hypothetical protein
LCVHIDIMFQLPDSFFDHVREEAHAVIAADRIQYLPIFEAVERYVIKHKLIISKDYTKSASDVISIFTEQENAYKHSRALTDELAELVESWPDRGFSLNLSTVIPHCELNIGYDGRWLVYIRSLPKHPKINFYDMTMPETHEAIYLTGEQILIMPPEIELIEIYRQLYTPANFEQWEHLSVQELPLLEILDKRIESGVITRIGGACENPDILRQRIIYELCPRFEWIITGAWAVAAFRHGKFESSEKLELISAEPIEEIVKHIKEHLGLECGWQKHDLRIPRDYRTHRTSVWFVTSCGKKALFDVFNSADHELIPWINSSKVLKADKKGNIMIANPFVCIRFLLIDMWLLRIVVRLQKIPKEQFKIKVGQIWRSITWLRKSSWMSNIFTITNYAGSWKDPMIWLKKILADSEIPQYFPAQIKARGNAKIKGRGDESPVQSPR